MINIPMEQILEKTGSIYKLVILAARRASELNAGAAKLVECSPNTKLSMVALEEIRQGKVRIKEQIRKTPEPRRR